MRVISAACVASWLFIPGWLWWTKARLVDTLSTESKSYSQYLNKIFHWIGLYIKTKTTLLGIFAQTLLRIFLRQK